MFLGHFLFSQSIPANQLILQDFLRRSQLLGHSSNSSFLMRSSMQSNASLDTELKYTLSLTKEDSLNSFNPIVRLLPLSNSFLVGSGRPYPEVSNFLQAKGFQNFSSLGIFGSLGPISIQIQPEFIVSQNKKYDVGFSKEGKIEYVENFGSSPYSKLLPGQSSIRFNYGAFSVGASTENIWWGPGQFNSLLFSSNAFGFEHVSLNTTKPAETFLGDFEGQLILGKLNNFAPFVRGGKDDWRYVNGIIFSYHPKWIPGLFFGASRVFQQYSSFNNRTLGFYFPIFEPFQKKLLIDPNSKDFDSTEYDEKLQSQQLTGFARFVIPNVKAEIYFEYGRRDHAVDWREFILNPEHARAYLLGFKKLINLEGESFFQINGEILQQQESINILTRYGPIGGASWAAHDIIQGFTHQGQLLGPGVGPSSNVQTLETSWVNGMKKIGARWERLNRHQDVFVRVFNKTTQNGRWVDYSARLLSDWKWKNFVLSSSINFVYSINPNWNVDLKSTNEFPVGKKELYTQSQINLIYFWGNIKK